MQQMTESLCAASDTDVAGICLDSDKVSHCGNLHWVSYQHCMFEKDTSSLSQVVDRIQWWSSAYIVKCTEFVAVQRKTSGGYVQCQHGLRLKAFLYINIPFNFLIPELLSHDPQIFYRLFWNQYSTLKNTFVRLPQLQYRLNKIHQ